MRWSAKRNVKKLLLSVRTPIKSSELLKKARERNIGVGTLFKYLKEFENEGVVSRIQKSHKNVYYVFDREADVKNILKDLAEQTEEILQRMSEPSTIEKWRKFIRERPLKRKITEDTSLEEVRSIAKEMMEELGYGALHRCLWLMHRLIMMGFPNFLQKMDVFIHVSEEGAVTIIPKALLKEKGVLRS